MPGLERTDATDELRQAFGAERVRSGERLAAWTTFGIGGPADWLLETLSTDETLLALRLASARGLPVTILGGGSNVLISDRGIRGLVLRPRAAGIERVEAQTVRAEAAATINGLVRWTIVRGLGGLERWAGTPGTVGGGIHGNAHFDGHLLGERVVAVGLASVEGSVRVLRPPDLEFGYDRSRLQRTHEVLLWASFRVEPGGSPAELRARARESLAFRKRTQPLAHPSAGCAFKNPTRREVAEGIPASAGALVDQAGCKGLAVGGAAVSATHANFIVNRGGATAEDVRQLIRRCQSAVRARFGVHLQEEIVYLGEFRED